MLAEITDQRSKLQENSSKWWLLPGTGFNVRLQVDKLRRELDVNAWLDQTEEDLKGFWLEYLASIPVLPINIEFSNVDGRKRIVCPKYKNQLWIDTTSDEERSGSIKKSVGEIEDFLSEAPPGSMAFFTSPPGWSGYGDVPYPNSQTYLFKIDKNSEIDALTIISDMNLIQNRDLLEIFEVYAGSAEERETIKKITGSPVFLNGKEKVFEFEDVVTEIENLMATKDVKKGSTFEELRELIRKRKDLGQFVDGGSSYVQVLIDNFRSKAKMVTSLDELEYELGKTVLEIFHCQRSKDNKLDVETKIDYSQALSELQKNPGCNGGGVIETSLGPRAVEIGIVVLCCTCPFCGKEVPAEIYEGKIHCPKNKGGCGAEAPYTQK